MDFMKYAPNPQDVHTVLWICVVLEVVGKKLMKLLHDLGISLSSTPASNLRVKHDILWEFLL